MKSLDESNMGTLLPEVPEGQWVMMPDDWKLPWLVVRRNKVIWQCVNERTAIAVAAPFKTYRVIRRLESEN